LLLPFIRKYLFLLLAVLVVVCGIVTAAVFFTVNNPVTARVHLHVPGHTELNLVPGKYLISYEYAHSIRRIGPLELTVGQELSAVDEQIGLTVQDASGLGIPLVVDKSYSYTIDDRKGKSIAAFSVASAGWYSVSAEPRDSVFADADLTVLADFNGLLMGLFKLFGLFIAAAIPLLLIGLWRIRRARNESA